MKKVNTFSCRVKPIEAGFDNIDDQFELLCEYAAGNEVVLFKGCYSDCLQAMEEYFRRLIKDPSRNVVRWRDKLSFIVHEIVEQDADITIAGGGVCDCG